LSAVTSTGRNPAITSVVENSLGLVERWVEAHDYRGYEPFDGLNSPLRRLTLGNLLLDRLLLQLIRQSPVNLRPLFGVRPLESTFTRWFRWLNVSWWLALGLAVSLPKYSGPLRTSSGSATFTRLIRPHLVSCW